MTTFDLLNNPLVLKEGLGYLSQLTTNQMRHKEMKKMMAILNVNHSSKEIDEESMPDSPDVDNSKKKSKKRKKSKLSLKHHQSFRSSKRIRERDIANSASTNAAEDFVETIDLVTESSEEEFGEIPDCPDPDVDCSKKENKRSKWSTSKKGDTTSRSSKQIRDRDVANSASTNAAEDFADTVHLVEESGEEEVGESPGCPGPHKDYSKKNKESKRSKSNKDDTSTRSSKRIRERDIANFGSANVSEVFVENVEIELVEESGDAVESDTKIGRKLVKKLMKRCTQVNPEQDDKEETNSLPPGGVANFIPGYTEKKARYNNNAELVKNLTEEELIDHYEEIRSELKDIFDSKLCSSERHNLFLEGWSRSKPDTLVKENSLKDLNISIPFTGEHAMILISCLNEYLLPKSEVPEFVKYISYVMLPEALIRIYGRVTNQTYEMAELEMRYGACYEQPMLL